MIDKKLLKYEEGFDKPFSEDEIEIISDFYDMINKTYNVEIIEQPVSKVRNWGNQVVTSKTYKLDGETALELFRSFNQDMKENYIAIYKFGILRTPEKKFFTIRVAISPEININGFVFKRETYFDICSIIEKKDLSNFISSIFSNAKFLKGNFEYSLTKTNDYRIELTRQYIYKIQK